MHFSLFLSSKRIKIKASSSSIATSALCERAVEENNPFFHLLSFLFVCRPQRARHDGGSAQGGNFKCPANKKNTRLGNEIASLGCKI
jgi:hypothetical protein